VVNVDPGARVASRTGFAVVVRATDDNHRIVAETSMSETAGADGRGVATATGAAVAARSWAFAGRPAGTSAAIVALNPGPESVTIVLRAYGGAGADDVTSSPAVDVSLGRIARFDLAALGVAPAEVFVVTANGPVVAGRGVAAPSCSLALGVPVEG
jgi:hypothetical protein